MNGHEQFFLANLIEWTGAATTDELSPQISQKENSARQSCKRKGWVSFDRPYWRITDAGRQALTDSVQSHIRAMAGPDIDHRPHPHVEPNKPFTRRIGNE